MGAPAAKAPGSEGGSPVPDTWRRPRPYLSHPWSARNPRDTFCSLISPPDWNSWRWRFPPRPRGPRAHRTSSYQWAAAKHKAHGVEKVGSVGRVMRPAVGARNSPNLPRCEPQPLTAPFPSPDSVNRCWAAGKAKTGERDTRGPTAGCWYYFAAREHGTTPENVEGYHLPQSAALRLRYLHNPGVSIATPEAAI